MPQTSDASFFAGGGANDEVRFGVGDAEKISQ